MAEIPFTTTDWSKLEPTERSGERGLACWCTRQFVLKPGMHYQSSDNAEPHRASVPVGAKLIVVD